MFERKTIAATVGIEGVGLHSGIYTRLELHPAAAGSGLTFLRSDLNGLRIPALQTSTTALDYATTVGRDDVSIGTVEHLLAAIAAYGITDLDIVLDGPEVPIVDGSALPFMHLLDAAGIRNLGEQIAPIVVTAPVEVRHGEKFIRIAPAKRLSIRYRINFAHPVIGRQSFHYEHDAEVFLRRIAPARTFGFLRDVEKMRAAGLARGGSVENCIVLGDERIVSGALRFRDEFVRHKILDLVGDLALIGRPILGEIVAERAGHALHAALIAKLLESEHSWRVADSDGESHVSSDRQSANA